MLVVAATTSAGMLAVAGPASASVITGTCYTNSGQMCLYYNSKAYGWGAEYGSYNNVYSFNPQYNGGNTYEFKAGPNGSAGAGQTVWNNAAAAYNIAGPTTMRVFANHGYQGAYDAIQVNVAQDLSATHNNDTSEKWWY